MGLAALIDAISASRFSVRFFAPNDVFPKMVWIIPVLSFLNSIRPPTNSSTAFSTSGETVPAFGFGISPFGPSTRATLASCFIIVGVATATSKSVHPLDTFSISDSAPASVAPAALASFTFSSSQNTATFTVFPVPCGSDIVVRTCWSACLGSTPKFMCNSAVASNLTDLVSVISFTASESE